MTTDAELLPRQTDKVEAAWLADQHAWVQKDSQGYIEPVARLLVAFACYTKGLWDCSSLIILTGGRGWRI